LLDISFLGVDRSFFYGTIVRLKSVLCKEEKMSFPQVLFVFSDEPRAIVCQLTAPISAVDLKRLNDVIMTVSVGELSGFSGEVISMIPWTSTPEKVRLFRAAISYF